MHGAEAYYMHVSCNMSHAWIRDVFHTCCMHATGMPHSRYFDNSSSCHMHVTSLSCASHVQVTSMSCACNMHVTCLLLDCPVVIIRKDICG